MSADIAITLTTWAATGLVCSLIGVFFGTKFGAAQERCRRVTAPPSEYAKRLARDRAVNGTPHGEPTLREIVDAVKDSLRRDAMTHGGSRC